ncbi:hypothetical protein ZWY2020_047129 [Hordeum vulgare]|nr:hypothetical protein ZWY2020_047129 [Hordeum vulgare]
MGNMVLLDKEAEGMVFSAPEPRNTTKARWAVVGKSCSSRPLNLAVLEKTMQRAWGLHKAARFRDLGGNVFEVHFGSEGDWRHVLHNGPWQYDFSILIVKEYDGGTRPSKMVFDKVDIWIQVQDLPPDRRTEEFGNALGNWLGKVVRVDVDEEGKARGQHLRVRALISVFEPLVRGFFLKSSVEEKRDSRTGVEIRPERKQGMSPNNSRDMAKEQRGRDLRLDLEQRREEVLRGKLVDEQQQRDRVSSTDMGTSIAAPPCTIASQSALANWLLGWFADASHEQRETMIQSTYALWMARNETKEGRKIEAPHEITARVCGYIEEWRGIHAARAPMPKHELKQRWCPPQEGWTKVNSDGATDRHGRNGGGGVVFRTDQGGFLAGICHFFPRMGDPESAEIMACQRALKFAADIQVQRIHLELDCQALVQKINRQGKDLSASRSWVEDIKSQLRGFVDFRVSWIRRSANVGAHKLAKIGVGEEVCSVWQGSPPDCILDVIADDIPNLV